jgi:hypothetical protein
MLFITLKTAAFDTVRVLIRKPSLAKQITAKGRSRWKAADLSPILAIEAE